MLVPNTNLSLPDSGEILEVTEQLIAVSWHSLSEESYTGPTLFIKVTSLK
jgi:hypothetical protein